MTTNFMYLLTGDNANTLKSFTPYCRKKIGMMASLLILITTIWLISGYLIAKELLGYSTAASLIIAVVCGFIVFVLERAIIVTDGTKGMLVFRLFMGIVVALISSFLVDALIFKNDTNLYMAEQYGQKATSAKAAAVQSFDADISAQQQNIQVAYNNWKLRTDEYNGEVNGNSGTHIPGFEKAAQAKKEIMNTAQLEYTLQQQQLNKLKQQQTETGNQVHANTLGLTGEQTLLHRIDMMHEMVSQSASAKFVYCLFFLFALCIELMVVFVKTVSHKSAYEKEQEALEQIMLTKRNRMLHLNAYHAQMGVYGGNQTNQGSTVPYN